MVADRYNLVEALEIIQEFCDMTNPELVDYIERLKSTNRELADRVTVLEAQLKEI